MGGQMGEELRPLDNREEEQRDLLNLIQEIELVLKRRSFDEVLPKCSTGLGNRFRTAISKMHELLRDHSIKMIALVEALAGANRLYSEKIKELSSMRRVSDALSSTLDLNETCRLATEVLSEEAGADACYLFLIDEQTTAPILRSSKTPLESAKTHFAEPMPKVDDLIIDLVVKTVNTCEPEI
ncbi:MAG: hypothetical protein JW941_10425, partial [Candidatus Coatesbacteria bacterium]|nr:hypothetical protein [Candidatus Coatesbacteria bacterium]